MIQCALDQPLCVLKDADIRLDGDCLPAHLLDHMQYIFGGRFVAQVVDHDPGA